MGAYQKVGRGGAGNFYSKKDNGDISPIAKDALSSQSSLTPLAKATTNTPPPEYQHSGRGGAGNWYQPTPPEAQEPSHNASPKPPSGFSTALARHALVVGGKSKGVYRAGRGGAGNYVDLGGEERRAREAEEMKRGEMERAVERDVEAGLARPPRAYGGVGGAFEMA